MKHVWDIDYCPKKLPEQMNVFELRDYVKRLEEKLESKDETIKTIIDGNRRPHGEWIEVPKYKGYYVCSECLKRLDGDFERFEHWEMRKDNFCHVCGSDNRKEGEAE